MTHPALRKVALLCEAPDAESLRRALSSALAADVALAPPDGPDRFSSVVAVDARGAAAAETIAGQRAASPDAVILALVCAPDDERDAALIRAGADDCLAPAAMRPAELARALRFALERRRGALVAVAIQANLPGLVFRRVLHTDGRIAYDYVSAARPLSDDAYEFADDFDAALARTHPDDRGPLEDAIRRSAEDLTRFDFTRRVVEAEGRIRWMRSIASPHRRPNGEVVWDGISLDVTAQKQAEERLAAVVANLPGNIFRRILHADGRIAFDYVSRRSKELFGLEADRIEREGQVFVDAIHPEDRDAWIARVHESARTGSRFDFEFRVARPDGGHRWVRTTADPRPGAAGAVYWDGITIDIGDMKRAAAAQMESEERLERLAANFPGVMFQVERSAEGRSTFGYLSPGTTALFGFTAEEIRKTPAILSLSVLPEDRPAYDAAYAESARTLAPGRWDGRIRTKAGAVKWIETYFQPRSAPDGAMAWDGVMFDVTERRRAQERLNEREAHLRAVAEHFPGILYQRILHMDGSVTYPYVSEGVRRMYGYAPEDLERNPAIFPAGVLDEDRARYRAELERSARTLTPRIWEGRERRKNGDVIWVQIFGQPRRLDNGDIIWDSIILDATERRRTEQALVESEARLRSITGNLPGNVYRRVLHPDGAVSYPFVGWGLYGQFGLDAEGELADPARFVSMIHEDERAGFQDAYRRSAANLSPVHMEYRLVLPSGEERWVEAFASVRRHPDGRVVWDGLSLDVSERKRAQQALVAARVAAEEANRAKSRFLANMSHEFRTPLNAIMGFSQIMVDRIHGPLGSAEYEKFAALIHGRGQHLLTIIADILDMSRIEAGRYELRRERVDLADIVKSACALVATTAQERGIALENAVAGPLAAERLDRAAARQVLLNILSNAVKFTDRGGRVSVEAKRAGGWIEVAVADTGIGIPANALQRIFVPFQQADDSLSRRHEGAGLGLSISLRLMELQGGTLEIESEVGRGTRATARFPAD